MQGDPFEMFNMFFGGQGAPGMGARQQRMQFNMGGMGGGGMGGGMGGGGFPGGGMGGGRGGGGGGGGLYDDDSNVEAPEGGSVPSDSPWVWLVEYYAPWWVGAAHGEGMAPVAVQRLPGVWHPAGHGSRTAQTSGCKHWEGRAQAGHVWAGCGAESDR